MKYITIINNNEFMIELDDQNNQILVNGEPYHVDLTSLQNSNLISCIINNRSFEAAVTSPERDLWDILLNGEIYSVNVKEERAYRLAKARGQLDGDSGTVPTKSPMPGVIVNVPVAVGDAVQKGDTIVILESMKMENELKATRDGAVLEVKVSPGDSVEKDAVLIIIGDAESDEEAG